MADLFFILNDVDIASHVDDNTPYVIPDDINGVITSLEKASKVKSLVCMVWKQFVKK